MTTETQMREQFEAICRRKNIKRDIEKMIAEMFFLEGVSAASQSATEQMKLLVEAAKDLRTGSISIGMDGRYLPDNDYARAALKRLLEALATIEQGGK